MGSNADNESEELPPPCQNPIIDDQGKSDYCTSNALAKASCSIFQKEGRDLSQDIIAACLYNKHDGNTGRSPTEFNGETFRIKDKAGNIGTIKMAIKKGAYSYKKEHVLVAKVLKDPFTMVKIDDGATHTMYLVREYTAKHGEYKGKDVYQCMNSWGQVHFPFPEIPVEIKPAVYEVDATWTDEPRQDKKNKNNVTKSEEKMDTAGLTCPNGGNIKSQSSGLENSYSKTPTRKKINETASSSRRPNEDSIRLESSDIENISLISSSSDEKKERGTADDLKHPNGDNSRSPPTGYETYLFSSTPTQNKKDGLAEGLKYSNEDNTNSQSSGIEKSSPKTPTKKIKNEPVDWITGNIDGELEYGDTLRFTVIFKDVTYKVVCNDKTRYNEILDLKKSKRGVVFENIRKTTDCIKFTRNTICKTVPEDFFKVVTDNGC